jgi:predicted ATP-dependent serine protease
MPEEKQHCELAPITYQSEEPLERAVAVQSNSKLISSCELREMNYKCLNFKDRWSNFFGLPAVVFHLAVHGKPGEGKSTFCIQFADYLAKSFGYVVYISGEEGFSKTLRDKVVNNKIDNPHLFFADISSFEQIKNEIESNKFHFIFIDSLDTLRIDVTRLRDLREYYPQSAFITISQSTKDGKMRGSQEIIHDADITLKVENGIAITTKNRFHPRGTEFQVFPISEKSTCKMIEEPRNVI